MFPSLRNILTETALSCAHILPPEAAHDAAIALLKRDLVPSSRSIDDLGMQTEFAGLALSHPIMLAAGFDKQGACHANLSRLGFSGIEAGTVVPKPQPGNAKPRLFRLKEDQSLINRFGFNSVGREAFFKEVARPERRGKALLGINIGANKSSADKTADYVSLVDEAASIADYLTINVSSPNTPGLRDLQETETLRGLVREVIAGAGSVPVLVKLAPDMDEATLDALLRMLADSGIRGVILSNTTIARPETLQGPHTSEVGGLSGPPLFRRTLTRIAYARQALPERVSLIASGGITSGHDVLKVMRAGASAVQIYTAFVYRGIETVPMMLDELRDAMNVQGLAKLSDVIAEAPDDLLE